MVRVKHQLPTIKLIDTEPRIQYSPNYCIDIIPKAKSQYRTSLIWYKICTWYYALYSKGSLTRIKVESIKLDCADVTYMVSTIYRVANAEHMLLNGLHT